MRLAIVGGGISGLTAAHLLQPDHDIVLFEANDYPGGHTDTHSVETESGSYAIDTGFIVFNDRNYPNFIKLMDRLGVADQPTTMSFSVKDELSDFEYSGGSANGLFAKRSHLLKPSFHRMYLDLLRFNRDGREQLRNGSMNGVSLRDYLDDGGYSRDFIEKLIVPQAAAVWSADPDQMWSFPAKFLLEFFDNHGILDVRGRPQWKSIAGGSKRYVEAITAPWADAIRLSTPVERIERTDDRVTLTPRGGEPEEFDQVVIATHADQALAMLADPSAQERELLGAFPYQRNDVVLHTDASVLPRRRRAWASWNYHLTGEEVSRPTVTYHMNRLQALDADEDFCVTLNRPEAMDAERVLKRITYSHPVFTSEGLAAQGRRGEISGQYRTWYCGAYWGSGFHEDGVVSALHVTEALGAPALA
ncbi:MAG: FAD-dependent oxidoreductase [Thermoleophilaceae bacterium]|nr:FAD-dependent oxidoreductase [Thermoleophilaceae bacterium]